MNSRKALIGLNMISGIGSIKLNRLIGKYKNPESIFKSSFSTLKQTEGIGNEIASGIVNFNFTLLDKEIQDAENKRIKIVTIYENEYPKLLKSIYDPPPVLYMAGKEIPDADLDIGIVGTRDVSDYGVASVKQIVKEMKETGLVFTLISGMARGVDSRVHKEAIKNNIFTVAVLGFGLNTIYPFGKHYIAGEICNSGVLISEFPLNMSGNKQNFPRRNRIISGMSDGVLLIEAGKRSGALITADCALEQGREIFALPGNISSVKSIGTNNLIGQGAKLTMCANDIIEEFEIKTEKKYVQKEEKKKVFKNFSPDEKQIYNILSFEKKHIDNISMESNMNIIKLNSVLTFMELKGMVKQLNGKNFIKS